jgi:hypothetical protein
MGYRTIIDVRFVGTGSTEPRRDYRLFEHWRDEGVHIPMLAKWLRMQFYGGLLERADLIDHAAQGWGMELRDHVIYGRPGGDLGDSGSHHELTVHTHDGNIDHRWITLDTRLRRPGGTWRLHCRAEGVEQVDLCAAREMRARARRVRARIKADRCQPYGWLTPEQYEHNAAFHEAAWPRHMNPDCNQLPTAQEAASWK